MKHILVSLLVICLLIVAIYMYVRNDKKENFYISENQLTAKPITSITDPIPPGHIRLFGDISGNGDKNRLGSLDFLHTHLIDNVFQKKDYFDFGSSNENNGLNINEGLQYWKEGFGARTITQDFYKVCTTNFRLLDDVML